MFLPQKSDNVYHVLASMHNVYIKSNTGNGINYYLISRDICCIVQQHPEPMNEA